MEQRTSSTWRMTVNERDFIGSALQSDVRIDGRRTLDYRRLTIELGREDGSSEIQLGETRVMGCATGQLIQPYRDRPNEGTLSIFTEFSAMADPSFEPGRPGESAIELGRIVDRGLRESKAVDMESLCVIPGKLVWGIRVDLQIIDNGGNLIDAANVAALAALLTFRRPECTLGGEHSQEVTVHPPEVKEPLPLIIHHLPVAVTFAFFSEGNITVIDPSYKEEAVMGGRMTATVNSNGDVCAIQKAGGDAVSLSVIMHCLRVASLKATDITTKIKDAVDSHNTERALRKVKRHPTSPAVHVNIPDVIMKGSQVSEVSSSELRRNLHIGNIDGTLLETGSSDSRNQKSRAFIGGLSNWDPYSKGPSSSYIRATRELPGPLTVSKKQSEISILQNANNSISNVTMESNAYSLTQLPNASQPATAPKSLKDAVKVKSKKKKGSSASNMN